jgi:hypothetical protein
MQRASAAVVGQAVAAAAAAAAAATAAASTPSRALDEGGYALADTPQVGHSPRRSPSPRRRYGRARAGGERAELSQADDGGLPALDILYRVYAPKELVNDFERLQAEVGGPLFRLYSAEDQAEALEDLADVRRALEERENVLNNLASVVGWLASLTPSAAALLSLADFRARRPACSTACTWARWRAC